MQSDHQAYVDEYVSFLRGFLGDDAKQINTVFDCSSGASGPVIDALFPDGIILNGRPDGNFPNHAPDPLHAGALDMLQKKVLSERGDVGIIFDADGDRMFVVDDKGRSVDPDAVTYLLLWSLRPTCFISDLKAGWLIKSFDSAQNRPFDAKRIESKTGHYFIKEFMRKRDASFGHEASGHYYFEDRGAYYDSGIRAAIEVLNAIVTLPYRLSDFVDLLPITHKSSEMNFPVPFTDHAGLLAHIESLYKKVAVRASKLDGITLEFNDPDWWFNVRFSNTEPLARLTLEAHDRSVYDAQLKKLTYLLKRGTK